MISIVLSRFNSNVTISVASLKPPVPNMGCRPIILLQSLSHMPNLFSVIGGCSWFWYALCKLVYGCLGKLFLLTLLKPFRHHCQRQDQRDPAEGAPSKTVAKCLKKIDQVEKSELPCRHMGSKKMGLSPVVVLITLGCLNTVVVRWSGPRLNFLSHPSTDASVIVSAQQDLRKSINCSLVYRIRTGLFSLILAWFN